MATRTTGGPIKVFFSYSHKDERLENRLETHLALLKREGAISGWNFRKITAGREWEGDIDEHLNSAQVILLLVSTDFLASDYCYDAEMKRAMERHEGGEARVIPVILRPSDWKGAPFGKLQALPTDARPVTRWRNRDEAFANVVRGIRKAVEELVGSRGRGRPAPGAPSVDAPGALPDIWNVPHRRNLNFTGREAHLEQLQRELESGQRTALTAVHGMGGVGKTELAKEYSYRHASDYEVVWWVRSEEPAKLSTDYAALAGALDLPEKDATEQYVIVEAVRDWLERNGGWLLVFDNVPGPESVREYLPRGATGHVIITSRNPAWGGVASPLAVQPWEREESVEFLLGRTGQDNRGAAGKVADALGDLPLALEQAAAYVDDTKCSMSHYLNLLKEHESDLLAKGADSPDYSFTVATTWGLSFEQVEEECPAAADLLNLCAFLAPDDIPLDIIREGAEHLPDRLAAAVRDPVKFDEAIAALRRYALAEVSASALSVHRLVQAVTRDRLAQEEQRGWAAAAVRVLNDAFPGDIQTNVAAWPVCALLLPHALAVAAQAEELGVVEDAVSRLLNDTGVYLREYGWFEEARSCIQRALRIDEAAYGPDHPSVARRSNNLGSVLLGLGDLAGARAHFERALEIHEVAYGPDHPGVATSVNNLGSVLLDMGDLTGARAHFERALRVDEVAYGPDHPALAIDLSNLAAVLAALGETEAARRYLQRALQSLRLALGEDHPNVALVQQRIAALEEPAR